MRRCRGFDRHGMRGMQGARRSWWLFRRSGAKGRSRRSAASTGSHDSVLLVDTTRTRAGGSACCADEGSRSSVSPTSGTGRSAQELCPDVVVMDVHETARRDSARHVACLLAPVLVSPHSMTMRCCPAWGIRLRQGAPGEELCARRAVAEGEGWLDPSVTERVLTLCSTATVTDGQAAVGLEQLTARRRRSCSCSAERPTATSRALVRQRATVKSHVGHFTKLGVQRSTIGDRVRVRHGLAAPRGG
jgi:hypothetical protein